MGKHPFSPAADFLSSRNLYHTLPVYTDVPTEDSSELINDINHSERIF